MKKRILVVLLLMIAAVLLLSSCDFDFVADLLPHEHVHEYGKWNVTTEATCTENGMMCRECECGEKEYKTIAATGHSFTNWYVTHAPTCTENGEEHRTCANCDYYETRTIEANGHSYGDNALSISEDGTTATIDYVCKVCNEELHSPYTGNFVNNNIAYYFENGIKKDIVNDEIEFNGNTYYVIDNEVQINVYIRIENNIYYYGEDGVKDNETIANREVTDNNGDTYYIINNVVQINVYIRIENNIYYYGENGVKDSEVITNREVTDNNSNIYYVINNEVQTNAYIRIENNVYYYGENGVKSSETITNKEVTDNNGNTYYIINNKVQINVYIRIENNVYYYGENGVKSNNALNNTKVTDNTGKTYYIINNIIQINIYVLIENRIYYFNTDGSMLENGTHDGYIFGKDGALTGSDIVIKIDDNIYEINDGEAATHTVCVDKNCDHKCDICGKVTSKCVTEDENAIWIPKVEATCTYNGTLGHYHCYVCKKDFDIDKNILSTIVIKATDHSYGEWIDEIPATCTEDGTAGHYHCSICETSFDENKKKLDSLVVKSSHKYENGICTLCGENKSSEGLYYKYDSATNSYYVSSIGDCKDTDIVIPSMYNELPVTSINSYAFQDCLKLTSITIPDSVTSIGEYAFDNCTTLTEINYNATNLNDLSYDSFIFNNVGQNGDGIKVTIGANVKKIPAYLFFSNSSTSPKITEVVFAEDSACESIGNVAFFKCIDLTSIVIPNSVTSIGADAFYGCTELTSITIPDSVTLIGNYAFSGCSKLETITVNTGNTIYHSKDNCVIETATNTLILGCKSSIIPDYVILIGDSAFYECTGLTSVTIGNGVTSIGSSAFSGCTGLTSVVIPDSVTSIGNHAFYECTSLTSVTIGNGVTSIDWGAFSDCTGLTSVYYNGTIDEWVEISFKDNPLYYAENLYINNELVTEANITTATKISAYAFHGYNKLTIVTIGNNVTSIGEYAFSGCTNLSSVTIDSGVTSIGSSAFYDCTALINITIPDSVTSIGSYVFYNTAYYNNDNNWDNGELYIGNHLIKAKDSVSGQYKVKEGTITISGSALCGCTEITSITIPSSVRLIPSNAFYFCTELESIILDEDNTIYHSKDNCVIETATNTLVLGCKSSIIPDYVTSIGNLAFSGCTGLTSIEIPNNVTSIGFGVFIGCTGLTSIEIPNSVTTIGEFAFQDCTGLASITISESVTTIGYSAFRDCTGLTDVYYTGTIDQWVEISFGSSDANPLYYAENLYINNELLTEANITTATKISDYAFYNCKNLTSINISDDVTSIGSRAFEGCANLTSITIPDSVTSIASYTFYGCTRLTNIKIPNSVTSIGDYIFRYCTKLETINYTGTKEQWNAINKGSYWNSNTGNYTINFNYSI